MKNKIAFLFTGQSITNTLSDNNNTEECILNSYNSHIFTEEFKKNYDYDIFIVTDNISIEKVNNYFNNNLKNIYIKNINYIKNKIKNNDIKDIDYYLNNYLNVDKNVKIKSFKKV